MTRGNGTDRDGGKSLIRDLYRAAAMGWCLTGSMCCSLAEQTRMLSSAIHGAGMANIGPKFRILVPGLAHSRRWPMTATEAALFSLEERARMLSSVIHGSSMSIPEAY